MLHILRHMQSYGSVTTATTTNWEPYRKTYTFARRHFVTHGLVRLQLLRPALSDSSADIGGGAVPHRRWRSAPFTCLIVKPFANLSKLGSILPGDRINVSVRYARTQLSISISLFRHMVTLCSISRCIGTRSIPVRQLSCHIPSCHVYTCDHRYITSVFVITIHTCESNANPLSRMYAHVIETTSYTHTCESNVNPLPWMYAHVIETIVCT